MQKFIRIMAIIAAVLVGFSLLLLLISTPFQQSLGKLLDYPEDILGLLPIFPLSSFINCFLLLGCCILLIVCAGNKKGGIWLEILLLAAVILVLPLLDGLLSNVLQVAIVNTRGHLYTAAYSVTNTISSFCMYTGSLGRALLLVVCGMSIVFKRMSKKLEKVAE